MKREVKRDHQPEAVQLVGWKPLSVTLYMQISS